MDRSFLTAPRAIPFSDFLDPNCGCIVEFHLTQDSRRTIGKRRDLLICSCLPRLAGLKCKR